MFFVDAGPRHNLKALRGSKKLAYVCISLHEESNQQGAWSLLKIYSGIIVTGVPRRGGGGPVGNRFQTQRRRALICILDVSRPVWIRITTPCFYTQQKKTITRALNVPLRLTRVHERTFAVPPFCGTAFGLV